MDTKTFKVRGTFYAPERALARLLIQGVIPQPGPQRGVPAPGASARYCRAINVSLVGAPDSHASSSSSARVSVVCADPSVPNYNLSDPATYAQYIAIDEPWVGATFYASFLENYNAQTRAQGDLAPVTVSSAPLASGGVNMITGADAYIDYVPGLIRDPGMIGGVRFIWKPTEVAPAAALSFFDYNVATSGANDLSVYLTTGNVVVLRKGYTDGTFDDYAFIDVSDNVTPFVFAHDIGNEYIVDVRFDLTPGTGINRLLIDGIFVATALTQANARAVGPRTNLTIGNTVAHSRTAQVGRMSDFLIMSGIGAQPTIQFTCSAPLDSRGTPRAEFNLMQLASSVESRMPPMGPITYAYYPYIVRVYAPVEFLATIAVTYTM